MQIPNGWQWEQIGTHAVLIQPSHTLHIRAGKPTNNVASWIGEYEVNGVVVKRWQLTAFTPYGACTQARLWHEQVLEGIHA